MKKKTSVISVKKVKPAKVSLPKKNNILADNKITSEEFIKKLKKFASRAELQKYHRFFKFDEKDKSGDQFIGVRMGQVFALAKEFIKMSPDEIEKLLESPVHEIRAGGCSIMGKQATDKNTTSERKKELFELYLRRHDRINNWDLVDLASYKVVGNYLYNSGSSRSVLYKLARSKNIWERRTSILSTMYFIGKKELDDTFSVAEKLLSDDQDLVHKATGWALRYAGQKDIKKLIAFLDKHASSMPRAALRYSIEHLDKKKRDEYLKK